jgi:signal transduction histidine kinase
MSKDFIHRQVLFAGLSDQDTEWLASMAKTVTLPAGEYLMREGTAGDSLYVVIKGELQVVKRSGGQDVVLAVRGPGEIFGEMSLLDRAPHSASVLALQECQLLEIGRDAFMELLATRPQATLAILRTVTERLRNTEAMLRQSEKMAALGTLSAGLAHELNNPAAAAKRSAVLLAGAMEEWQALSGELDSAALDTRQRQSLQALRGELAKRASASAPLDPLARSDREGETEAWLQDHGFDRAWELAPTLVGSGWDSRALQGIAETFGTATVQVVRWLASGMTVHSLVDDVSKSSERISEIVKAVKSYSYLDQAPIQEIDVHEGLENTLVIMRHKLKQGVHVTRQYTPDLPHIEAYGSELNQVWTNIVDNAIDAMQGKGELVLRTLRNDDSVVVEITDNGPGMPPEVAARVFEPFFTTKPPGLGTGLGLHVSYNIVEKHHGRIEIQSQPGGTTFKVTLPLLLKRGTA